MQEIDTDHQFRPTKICKNSFTFFVIKYYRIRVTTYLWERDICISLASLDSFGCPTVENEATGQGVHF